MQRWEIRRYIQDTKPFDVLLFTTVLLEKLTDKKILSDEDIIHLIEAQRGLAEQAHYQ